MSIAHKNILELRKNPYGNVVIDKIVKEKAEERISYLISSQIAPELEWERVKNKLDFNKHTNFIVIGIGNGNLIEKIYHKMSAFSTLTVIEKNRISLINVLGTKDLSEILPDSRIAIFTGDVTQVSNLMRMRFSEENFVFNTPNTEFITFPYMKSMDENYVNEILYYASSRISYNTTSFGNDINDIIEGFDHIIDNWFNMIRGTGIDEFKDVYKGVPAIIVSAGPSLDKNIELLKKVYGKALILTVDATARKVIDLGIIPDAISTIERPEKMFSIFYEELNVPEGTAFLGPSVVTKAILDKFNKLIVTGRSGEVVISSIAKLLEYGSIELGMCCSHIPFAFAKYIGADPIVFMGQDLAFTKEGKTHFDDVEEFVAKNANSKYEKWVVANDGSKLPTNTAYYNFLLWFENEIASTKDRTFINATEGGARIKGTQLMTLSEVIETYCNDDIVHLGQKYQGVIDNKNIDIEMANEKILSFLDNLICSCSELQGVAKTEKQVFIQLSNGKADQEKFEESKKKLYDELFRNNILRFIYQPVYVSYNRSVHMYPVQMTEQQWKKITFEAQSYCDKLDNVAEALRNKFDEYKMQIQHEKGDSLETRKIN